MLNLMILQASQFAGLVGIGIAILFIFILVVAMIKRYKRCPSDRILVVYGKVGGGESAKCIHGGAAFIFPVIQDYQFLDLTPISIEVNLVNALSKQNIRVNVPSRFTIGISTEPTVMQNAAERLLGLPRNNVQQLAYNIIVGQMRLVIATMDIEEINRSLAEVDEYKVSLEKQDFFPIGAYKEVDEELRMLEIEGFVLPEEGLQKLNVLLLFVKGMFKFFTHERQEIYERLYDVIRPIHFNNDLLQAIEKVIDEEGEIRADASPDLMKIRRISKRYVLSSASSLIGIPYARSALPV